VLFLQTYGRAEGKRRRFYEPLPSYVKNYAKGVDPCQAPDAARRVFNIQNGLKASFIFAAKSPAANRRVLHANERSLVTMSTQRRRAFVTGKPKGARRRSVKPASRLRSDSCCRRRHGVISKNPDRVFCKRRAADRAHRADVRRRRSALS